MECLTFFYHNANIIHQAIAYHIDSILVRISESEILGQVHNISLFFETSSQNLRKTPDVLEIEIIKYWLRKPDTEESQDYTGKSMIVEIKVQEINICELKTFFIGKKAKGYQNRISLIRYFIDINRYLKI